MCMYEQCNLVLHLRVDWLKSLTNSSVDCNANSIWRPHFTHHPHTNIPTVSFSDTSTSLLNLSARQIALNHFKIGECYASGKKENKNKIHNNHNCCDKYIERECVCLTTSQCQKSPTGTIVYMTHPLILGMRACSICVSVCVCVSINLSYASIFAKKKSIETHTISCEIKRDELKTYSRQKGKRANALSITFSYKCHFRYPHLHTYTETAREREKSTNKRFYSIIIDHIFFIGECVACNTTVVGGRVARWRLWFGFENTRICSDNVENLSNQRNAHMRLTQWLDIVQCYKIYKFSVYFCTFILWFHKYVRVCTCTSDRMYENKIERERERSAMKITREKMVWSTQCHKFDCLFVLGGYAIMVDVVSKAMANDSIIKYWKESQKKRRK